MTDAPDPEPVLHALQSRRSVRAFLDRPVPHPVIERILEAAARAPSGNNTQPWRTIVLTGAAKARLSAAILAERAASDHEPTPEYAYYPAQWPEPYLARRRAVGWELYALLGIGKGDRAAARAWHDRNFDFFGAPVGMIFTLDRRLGAGAYLDLGMFIQAVMTGARGFGLDTCAQAAFAAHHATIRAELALPPEALVVWGLALGTADPAALPNQLTTTRVPLADHVTFRRD